MRQSIRTILGTGIQRTGLGVVLLAGLMTSGVITESAAQIVSANDHKPTDVSRQIVGAFDAVFNGPHDGARAVHAKGELLEGHFVAAPEAVGLSRAPHLTGNNMPVLVRLSNFAGVPDIDDADPAASPRGMSIKFLLADGGSTDIVAHSYNGFPVSTPEDFLAFLRALAAPETGTLADFLATHPAALRFAEAPKPAPESYATETFYGVNAFVFTNDENKARHARYRIEPVAGPAHLSAEEAARSASDYLARELAERLGAGPVEFRLVAQLAGPGDDVTDGSTPWPKDRPSVALGTLTLTGIADDQDLQRDLLFTPLSLVDGISPSEDPMLIARNRAYRISHDRRTDRARIEGSSDDHPSN